MEMNLNEMVKLGQWNEISTMGNLTEEFMDEYQNQLNWGYICQTQKLSENFIRNHENKMVWNFVSKYQNLSEQFINDYQNQLNWEDRKSTRLNSSHANISYAVFCLKK